MDKTDIQPISWNAPEFPRKDRKADWYWSVGLIAVIGAGVAFFFQNYIFAIFILISGATLIIFAMHEPRDVDFEISSDGIRVDRTLFEYKNISGFSMKTGTPWAKLLIETKRYFLPVITIPLHPEDAEQIHTTLKTIMPEIELNESRSLAVMERLGF